MPLSVLRAGTTGAKKFARLSNGRLVKINGIEPTMISGIILIKAERMAAIWRWFPNFTSGGAMRFSIQAPNFSSHFQDPFFFSIRDTPLFS